MSSQLKQFLHGKGTATSRITSYNPRENGQVECLNGTLWKAIIEINGLPNSYWQDVLNDALHSICTLLCTSTGQTFHERLFNFHS